MNENLDKVFLTSKEKKRREAKKGKRKKNPPKFIWGTNKFSQQSDPPKCLKWLRRLYSCFFLLFLGLFLDSSIHGNLNSPLLSNSSPLQQRGFLQKEFPWYTFFMSFLIDGRVIFFQRNVDNIASHFNHRRTISRMQDSFAYNESLHSLTFSPILDSSFFQPLKYSLVPK